MPFAPVKIVRVSYDDRRHRDDLARLLHAYAEHETESPGQIPPDRFVGLPDLLREFPTAFSLLAYADDEAIGLTNCFFGFSTFAMKRLVNVHDVMVMPEARGQGVAGRLLSEVETIAKEHDCCRLTLEVMTDNKAARQAYAKQGFGEMPYHPGVTTMFLQKTL